MIPHWEQLLHYATLAPSGHNTQPWKFRVEDDRIVILPDRTRTMPVADPQGRELWIALGAALENLSIAANELGYEPIPYVHLGREPHIEVFLPHRPVPRRDPLFAQLELRQTTRSRYNGRPIPTADLELLAAEAAVPDVRLHLITDPDEKRPLVGLAQTACQELFSDKRYTEELLSWLRFSRSRAEASADGVSAAALGKPAIPEWLGRIIAGTELAPEKEARKCAEELAGSAALAVFVAARADIRSWVQVGRSFERFALAATALGIRMAPESSICSSARSQSELGALLRVKEGQPALLVRLGYGDERPRSLRRPVSQVTELVATLL